LCWRGPREAILSTRFGLPRNYLLQDGRPWTHSFQATEAQSILPTPRRVSADFIV
jgi:hypothetical protein